MRPSLLQDKLRRLRRRGEGREFFDLASRVLSWRWDRRDEQMVVEYQEQEDIQGFDQVALPQGLAAAGFFSNVVLLDFDDRIRDARASEIASGLHVEDVSRYVDDLQIVLRVSAADLDPSDIEEHAVDWLRTLLAGDPGLDVSEDKTFAAAHEADGRPVLRQSDRMARIQHAVSGGFDAAGGEAILEALQGLLQSQRRHPHRPLEVDEWPLSPLADVPDDSVGRFAAGRFRTAYRWLRPLLSDEDTDAEDGSSRVGSEPSTGRMEGTGLQLSRAELDNKAEVFSAGLIKEWVGNPSNIRLLRIGLDIWPSVNFLKMVLDLLEPFAESGGEDYAHRVAWYCMAELFRAGATETGFTEDADELPQPLDEYRVMLQEAAAKIASAPSAILPWYLRQQAHLFLATCEPRHDQIRPLRGPTARYVTLRRFLRSPEDVTDAREFATLAVLARRSFARAGRSLAAGVASQVDIRRLTLIAETDPSLALELLAERPELEPDLPRYLARDLSLPSARLPQGATLADMVLSGTRENPLRDELALLRFALKFLDILKRGQSGAITPSDLSLTFPQGNLEPPQARAGAYQLRLLRRGRARKSVYEPPSWCPSDERWRFQLGYLMRFILTAQEDFTQPVRKTDWQELRGGSYRAPAVHWRMRRYGFFNAQSAFGDRWLAITEWTERLLLDLLAWRGSRTPELIDVEGGLRTAYTAIEGRIEEILGRQGPAGAELLLPIVARRPAATGEIRSLNACVVQTVLPRKEWFPGDETLADPTYRRLQRRHLTTALEAVRSTLRLRGTHKQDAGQLDWLILPELSVHPEDLMILERFARSNKTIILAGLTYHETIAGAGPPYVNSAVWIIPEWSGRPTDQRGLNIRTIEQGKKYLAPSEEQLRVAGFRKAQWLIGYPWAPTSSEEPLWLTASICYDATDLSLASDLAAQADVYAIPALNTDVNTFDQMALALHYHMFQMVIVANNGAYGGSNAYVPYRERYERQVFHVHGQPQAAIAYVEIPDIQAFLNRLEEGRRAAGKSRLLVQVPSGGPSLSTRGRRYPAQRNGRSPRGSGCSERAPRHREARCASGEAQPAYRTTKHGSCLRLRRSARPPSLLPDGRDACAPGLPSSLDCWLASDARGRIVSSRTSPCAIT